MYVGRKHTATVTKPALLPYTCSRCNHEAFALVTGVGQGAGQSPFFLDENGAQQRATSEAEEAAKANAELTLALARCPSCQTRDESKHTALKGKVVAGSIACVFVFPLFGLLLDALHSGRSSVGLFIFFPLGFVMAWFVYASQKWKWETAENRVLFVSADDLSAALERADDSASE
jgi:hypothetical protein